MKRTHIYITEKGARLDISACPNGLLKALDDAFSYAFAGAFFTGRTQASGGVWDGKTHLFSKITGKIHIGLVDKLEKFLRNNGYKVVIHDGRKYKQYCLAKVGPDLLAPHVSMSAEFSYQYKAVEAALEAKNGILYMATNAGKTNVMAGLVKIYKQVKTNRILIIVPNKKKLAVDTRIGIAKAYGKTEDSIGFIGQGVFKPKTITVAMVGSLTNRNIHKDRLICAYLETVSVLMVDECHHVKAKGYKQVLRRINPTHRFGFSGSPFTGGVDDLYVEACFGPVIFKIRNKHLIKLGVSAKPTVQMVLIDEPVIEGSNFADVYKEGIVNNLYRNSRIVHDVKRDYASGQPSFVMVREKAHGAALSVMLKTLRIPHKFVYGTNFPGGVKAINHFFSLFETGKLPVLLATTGLVDEGLNIKNIRRLVVADGYKSSRLLLQKIGRALRRKTGANTVLIRDYADGTNRYLAEHALIRMQLYAAEGFKFENDKNLSKKRKNRQTTT